MSASTAARSPPRRSTARRGVGALRERKVRPVAAEDDVVERRHLERRREARGVVREAGVVVQAAQVLERAGGRAGRLLGLAVGERRQLAGDERRRPAEVRDLQPDVRIALERAAVDQVRESARRLEDELVQPDRMLRQREVVRRHRRVQEGVRAAPVELGEERVKGGVAEVRPADAREQQDAVEAELVVRARDLLDGGVRVPERQCRERGERVRLGAGDLRQRVVGDPRDLGRRRSGRAGGDHGTVDRVAVHEPLQPVERRRHGDRDRERVDVLRRRNVRVRVDPHPFLLSTTLTMSSRRPARNARTFGSTIASACST